MYLTCSKKLTGI